MAGAVAGAARAAGAEVGVEPGAGVVVFGGDRDRGRAAGLLDGMRRNSEGGQGSQGSQGSQGGARRAPAVAVTLDPAAPGARAVVAEVVRSVAADPAVSGITLRWPGADPAAVAELADLAWQHGTELVLAETTTEEAEEAGPEPKRACTAEHERGDAALEDRGVARGSGLQQQALERHLAGAAGLGPGGFPVLTVELLDAVNPPAQGPGAEVSGAEVNCFSAVEALRETHYGRPQLAGSLAGDGEAGVGWVMRRAGHEPLRYADGQAGLDQVFELVKGGGPGSFATVLVDVAGGSGRRGHVWALVNAGGRLRWVDMLRAPVGPGRLQDAVKGRSPAGWAGGPGVVVHAAVTDGAEQQLAGDGRAADLWTYQTGAGAVRYRGATAGPGLTPAPQASQQDGDADGLSAYDGVARLFTEAERVAAERAAGPGRGRELFGVGGDGEEVSVEDAEVLAVIDRLADPDGDGLAGLAQVVALAKAVGIGPRLAQRGRSAAPVGALTARERRELFDLVRLGVEVVGPEVGLAELAAFQAVLDTVAEVPSRSTLPRSPWPWVSSTPCGGTSGSPGGPPDAVLPVRSLTASAGS